MVRVKRFKEATRNRKKGGNLKRHKVRTNLPWAHTWHLVTMTGQQRQNITQDKQEAWRKREVVEKHTVFWRASITDNVIFWLPGSIICVVLDKPKFCCTYYHCDSPKPLIFTVCKVRLSWASQLFNLQMEGLLTLLISSLGNTVSSSACQGKYTW